MDFHTYFNIYMPAYFAAHPMERSGQAYFNALCAAAPEIANDIRGTDCDPFYDNERIGDFLTRALELMGWKE